MEAKRHWLISHEHYDDVLEELKQSCEKTGVALEPIPRFVLKAANSLVPFQRTKKNPIGYDYAADVTVAPRNQQNRLMWRRNYHSRW